MSVRTIYGRIGKGFTERDSGPNRSQHMERETIGGSQEKKELRAKAVPSIAVNGRVLFQSGIPQHDELIEAIREQASR